MVGLRSVMFLALAGVVISLHLPTQPRPALDLEFVKTGHGLLVMRHEVTIGQWRACVEDGGCQYMPVPGPGATKDAFPATGIGALDAQQFVSWVQEKVDPGARLPTLEEWSAFSGVSPVQPKKIFTDPRLAWAATYGAEGKVDPTLKAPGGFGHTVDGISDVKGNVWEWTSTCVVNASSTRCPAYIAAGEHEARVPVFVREPANGGCATGTPPAHLGLRLVKAP